MTLPRPPKGMTATERRSFRTLAHQLVDRGVDPMARAGVLEELVRIEARLQDLRADQAGATEPALKLKVTRALHHAQVEKRRLSDALWRGAKRPEVQPRSIAKAATTARRDEGEEAWRRFYWGDSPLTEAELLAKYGPAGWGPLLYEKGVEQRVVERLCEKYWPKVIPAEALRQAYREAGLLDLVEMIPEVEDDEALRS